MVNINLAGKNDELESKGKIQLERLLKDYNLEKYLFTNNIILESFSKPHSHPILTLNTRYIDNDDLALANLIHEELHWYQDAYLNQINKAIEDLKKIYPNVPVGDPEGAKDEYSTYLHLINNFLEFEELKKLIGKLRATKAIGSKDYYKWIYKKVLEDNSLIEKVVKGNKLNLD